ncbi:hypothetical protein B0H17DRAFT_1146925 [Mycena rosella]|uniref:Uncharacterized protein n=1 Tax=Mycena rosella TaxID=1033263 RepID=A0AAD7CMX3_MYCRO|nr:hypothetical protein B0H17DRAFT_1146925 [Mycena rosella]
MPKRNSNQLYRGIQPIYPSSRGGVSRSRRKRRSLENEASTSSGVQSSDDRALALLRPSRPLHIMMLIFSPATTAAVTKTIAASKPEKDKRGALPSTETPFSPPFPRRSYIRAELARMSADMPENPKFRQSVIERAPKVKQESRDAHKATSESSPQVAAEYNGE